MSISNYLNQLTEELREAKKLAIQKNAEILSDPSEDWFASHIREVENYLYGEQKPLCDIVGISTFQLPPPEQLNPSQKSRLYSEMESLLEAYNFYPDFPENLPAAIKYEVLRKNWENECVHMLAGNCHLEFCNYEPSECPYPEKYCSCNLISTSHGNNTDQS
jgi:hypothetical protein